MSHWVSCGRVPSGRCSGRPTTRQQGAGRREQTARRFAPCPCERKVGRPRRDHEPSSISARASRPRQEESRSRSTDRRGGAHPQRGAALDLVPGSTPDLHLASAIRGVADRAGFRGHRAGQPHRGVDLRAGHVGLQLLLARAVHLGGLRRTAGRLADHPMGARRVRPPLPRHGCGRVQTDVPGLDHRRRHRLVPLLRLRSAALPTLGRYRAGRQPPLHHDRPVPGPPAAGGAARPQPSTRPKTSIRPSPGCPPPVWYRSAST